MELIYVKDVDKSLLYQGFTIRTALLDPFINAFGKLKIGETRYISIILGGKVYSGIKVINQNFDREKYPDHPELYQKRYDNVRDLINHRIVHTYNPVFKRNLKVWIYPNGYKEGLNLHL